MTNIDEYAEWTSTIWQSGSNIHAAAYGLAEEVGEVMGLFKRRERGDGFDQEKFIKEMGDSIYYWCRLCLAHGVRPSEVLAENQIKLMDRKARGVLRGSGDNR